MLKFRILCIAFIVVPLFCVSQNTQELLCRIIDTKTSEPVVFASVAIKNQNVGVISDDTGSFRLPITYRSDKIIIIISCIGYKTVEVDVSSLSSNNLNILKVNPQVESLETITIIAKKDPNRVNSCARYCEECNSKDPFKLS
jgi:hypothetical protein